jgi:malonate decarboxylase acyl carrier protein
MALEEIGVSYKQKPGFITIPVDWSHSGIVGSGDMEAVIRRKNAGGEIRFKVVTPVKGFADVWKRVLLKFAEESKLGDAEVEINDNNATPFVVAARLRQALAEARGGEL